MDQDAAPPFRPAMTEQHDRKNNQENVFTSRKHTREKTYNTPDRVVFVRYKIYLCKNKNKTKKADKKEKNKEAKKTDNEPKREIYY